MNRNVSIVVVILVLVVIAGYLVWLRTKYQPTVSPQIQEVVAEPTPAASTEEATPAGKEATGSGTKSATSSSMKK